MLPRFAEDGHHAEPVTSWADCAERRLERQELRAVMRAALAELPDTYRAVIMMRDIEEMSTSEAAAAMGITENALKLRLHRARQALGTLVRQRLETKAAREAVPAVSVGARARRLDCFAAPATLLAV